MKKRILNEEMYSAYDNGFDRSKLRLIIENTLGESNELDFKVDIISESKIAKILLSMANSGGGTIIFGIADDGEAVGLQKEGLIDTTDLEKKINAFLPSELKHEPQRIEFRDETFGTLHGKIFYIFHVFPQDRYIPFIAKKESEHVKANQIYVRKNSASVVATSEDLEKIFKRRLLNQYEDLSSISIQEHIEQLKTLYNNTSETKEIININNVGKLLKEMQDIIRTVPNENYPKEDFDEFISELIKKKKRKIEIILKVADM